VLEPARSRSPEDAAIRSALGEAAYALGNPDAAAAHFRTALERKLDDAATWSGLALALSELRQHEAAITAGRRAVARDPRSGETHAALGHALTAAGDAASAVAVLERAVQQDPGSGRAWGLLAAARVRTARSPADFERARTALDQAEALLPGSARVAYTYGLLLSAQRRHEEAVAMFERALRRDPNYTDALYNLGVALAFSGRAAESKAVRLRFEKIRALERDIANLQLRLARDSENRTLWQRMLHLAEARGDRQRAAVARTHLYRGTQR
jgi:tetratricopeptide (TPR) repeat protein